MPELYKFQSDFQTEEYLHINTCGVLHVVGEDANIFRKGRNDYQIIYIAHGRCYLNANGENLIAEEGDVVIYRPGEMQDYSYLLKDNNINYWVHFSGTGCKALIEELNIGKANIIRLQHKSELENYMKRICDVFNTGKPYSKLLCTSLLAAVLALIGRHNIVEDAPEETASSKSVALISEAISTFKQSPNLWMGVKDCAKNCMLSEAHFSFLFKQVTGVAPGKFMTDIRIDRAKNLLLYSDFSIARIAEIVGYTDQNYFARIFKKNTGLTPLQYRKK